MSAAKQPAQATAGSPYRVPPEPNRWPSIGLAVGVHALLLAFLWIGVNWQNNTPVAVEAEVWDVKTQTAAPPPPPPQEVEPEPQPEQPKPVEKAVEPPPVETPLPPKQPDIALEREKKRKEEVKKRQQEEERERELAEKKAQELEKKELEKKELAKKEQAKKDEAEKKAKELAKKEKADKLAKAKAEKLENDKLAKLHADQVKRMMAAAGGATSTGDAEKSTAPRSDKGYTAAITAKVKGNTSYPGSLDEPGNPTVTFRVEQLPTGEIISVRKTKSSGVAAFDDAVERGIHNSSPLPKKKDGTVERSLVIEFHMKDLQ